MDMVGVEFGIHILSGLYYANDIVMFAGKSEVDIAGRKTTRQTMYMYIGDEDIKETT